MLRASMRLHAIVGQFRLDSQPAKRLVRNVGRSSIDIGKPTPLRFPSGFKVGNDATKKKREVHAMPAVAEAVVDIVVVAGYADGWSPVQRHVHQTVPGGFELVQIKLREKLVEFLSKAPHNVYAAMLAIRAVESVIGLANANVHAIILS